MNGRENLARTQAFSLQIRARFRTFAAMPIRLLPRNSTAVILLCTVAATATLSGQDVYPDRLYAEETRANNISTTAGYTPFGNQAGQKLNRYGDDGSAALVDLSGLVMWQTSNGVIRSIPNSAYARPLFVTDRELVLFDNAVDPNRLRGSGEHSDPDFDLPSRVSDGKPEGGDLQSHRFRCGRDTGGDGVGVSLQYRHDSCGW